VDRSVDVQVDGNLIHAQRLTGKPVADTYLMAAKLLGLNPRAVVIEDDFGERGRSAGQLGLVIGVAQRDADYLRQHGAHLVVNHLGQLVG
jgi:beta-phosphoglucomutase-like phosphatase (HAD superfamily)